VALSGDGRLLASASFDGTVRLWETAPASGSPGRPLATLQGHTSGVVGVALSGDGRLLATGSLDGMVTLGEAAPASGAPERMLATLQGHTGAVRGVALSGDGRLLASGSEDGMVRLWETPPASGSSGRPLAMLQGHTGGVGGVALSGDGRLVASGSFDGSVKLWETNSGACLRTLRRDRRYERLDITGLTGVTAAQRAALLALGARDGETAPGTASAPAQVSSPQETAAALVSAPPPEPGDRGSSPPVIRASRLGTPGCAARRPAPAASRARGDSVKILVVDDDQPILDALTVGFQLQWQDATVLVAGDGEAGLRTFYEHSPDVVVLDVALPGRSGFEVLQEIRRTSDVPVLMLTARGEELDQVRGLELGADDYVVKPVRHLVLLARIRAVLRRAELPPP
jgi:CheY-like chemotaxis protein